MNVDRMRRYSAGARESAEERERAAWVASHEHTRPLCSVCVAKSVEPMIRLMARL